MVLNDCLQINGDVLKPIDKKCHIQNQCVNVLIFFFKFKLEYSGYEYPRVQIL